LTRVNLFFSHEKPGRRTLKHCALMERRLCSLGNCFRMSSTSQLWNSVGFCLRHAKVLKARHMGKPTHRDARSRHGPCTARQSAQQRAEHGRYAAVVHVLTRRRSPYAVRPSHRRFPIMIHVSNGMWSENGNVGIRIVTRKDDETQNDEDDMTSVALHPFSNAHILHEADLGRSELACRFRIP
jgi:hypothetical protein